MSARQVIIRPMGHTHGMRLCPGTKHSRRRTPQFRGRGAVQQVGARRTTGDRTGSGHSIYVEQPAAFNHVVHSFLRGAGIGG